MILSPSVIASDVARLEEQARAALEAGADWLHLDVMDGHFVPNITIGPLVVEALRPLAEETGTPLDVHLMIEEPGRYVEDFVAAGATFVTVHVEACVHLHRVVEQIREAGGRPGVTLNPATPERALEPILPHVDQVLVMSVNPGFSGQSYIPESTGRIRRLRHALDQLGSRAHLSVDGGVKPENVRQVAQAGADAFVSGSAVFGGDGSIAGNVQAFRDALTLRA